MGKMTETTPQDNNSSTRLTTLTNKFKSTIDKNRTCLCGYLSNCYSKISIHSTGRTVFKIVTGIIITLNVLSLLHAIGLPLAIVTNALIWAFGIFERIAFWLMAILVVTSLTNEVPVTSDKL